MLTWAVVEEMGAISAVIVPVEDLEEVSNKAWRVHFLEFGCVLRDMVICAGAGGPIQNAVLLVLAFG